MRLWSQLLSSCHAHSSKEGTSGPAQINLLPVLSTHAGMLSSPAPCPSCLLQSHSPSRLSMPSSWTGFDVPALCLPWSGTPARIFQKDSIGAELYLWCLGWGLGSVPVVFGLGEVGRLNWKFQGGVRTVSQGRSLRRTQILGDGGLCTWSP